MDLPNGWSRHTDEHGRTYYHDKATGTTSWRPPPPRQTQPQPPPPPPQESPSAPPLSHSDSYRNSGFHPYPSAYPSSTPEYGGGYSYGQYPPQYSYHQPPSGAPHQPPPGAPHQPPQGSHPPPTSMPHQSLPHSQYPPPSGSPPGSYPSGPPGPPPSHVLPPSLQIPGSQPSHHPPGAPISHSHPGPPTSHAQSSPHPPLGSPPPHIPTSHAPPGPPGSHPPPPSHPPPGPPGSHPPPPSRPPPGAPGAHVPPYNSYPMPTHSYPPAYQHQDLVGSPSLGGYPSQDPHAQHAYPSHSSSYSNHPHMPPPHPANPPPPPGGYTHGSSQHMPPPPPSHSSPSSHPLQPPPQGYPSGSEASHPPPGSHFPPNHQPPYHSQLAQQPSQMSHLSQNVSGISAGMSNMSLGLGPASKVAVISLEFRALSLRDRDLIGKSDPVVNAYEPRHPTLDSAKVSEWKLLASTETLRNTVNPTWAKRVKTRYFFERHQPLRFEIIDVDNFKTMKGDHLGTVESTLAEIVRNGTVRLKLKNKVGNAVPGELIIRAHDDDPAGKVKLKLSFSGKGLDKKDLLGKSDPYYKLMRVLPGSGGTSTLYKSEEKMNDLNPTWKPHTLMLPVGSTPWEQVSMVVEVFDWDRYTPHDLIGEATFTLRDLTKAKMFPLINKKKKAKKGNRYKNSGELVVHRADAVEMPSFVSYLQGGLRLDFIVAVDFTASNRPADNPQSLHYMDDPNQPSQYYQALHGVGTILSDYLSDGYITALGFGAKLPGTKEASFDFSLNGQACARVYGVQGLLDAYKTALSNVTLAGPTNFTPIIKNAMGVANSVPVSQTNQHFAVLLILTDGIITDLSATVDTIIEASHSTPIAIVIVGVGKADFRAMERLDADDYKLRNDSGDKVAKHDIVQFTKYDPTKPIEYLASDVLHEVPQRVVEFLADAGIKPNPPVAQQQLMY